MIHVRIEYHRFSIQQVSQPDLIITGKLNQTALHHHQHRYHDMAIYVQSDFDFIIAGNTQTVIARRRQ